MTTRKRRSRSASPPAGLPSAAPAPVQASRVAPAPKWQWRTFPVFFAFSDGGLIGLELVIITTVLENEVVSVIAFLAFSLPLGFGMSHLTRRFMISHNWVRPRPAPKRKA